MSQFFDASSKADQGRICRYQGESDANAECIDTFAASTAEVFAAFREVFEQPDLPIGQVAITATNPIAPLAAEVSTIQKSMSIPGVVTVAPDGVELQEDGLHLTADSNVRVGKALAEALAPILSRQK